MATIHYQFADGHYEDVEVTEEFKQQYEFMLVQERARHWKEMQQKYRAGLRCANDFSLEKINEDGHELYSDSPDPLEMMIEKEERADYYRKLLSPLTDKQREVYILHHIKGCSKVQIAALLHIDESSVRERLYWAHKKILKNFL